MKSVIALTLVAGAFAVPASWSDAPVKVTSTTTTDAHKTWEDVTSTTAADPKTWEDVSSTVTSSTWADYDPKPTTTSTWADGTWSDAPVVETSTATWGDYAPVTVTTTVTDKVITYIAVPTTFVDKTWTYTATAGETKTLTHGPYTITIPISYETSTVCEGKPVAPTGGAAASSSWADIPAVPTSAAPVSPIATPAGGKPASPVDAYKGAATKMTGAGMAGVVAIAALLL